MRSASILALAIVSACGGGSTGPLATDAAASVDTFVNRKIYTRIDPTTLRSIPDAEVEQAIVDYAISKLREHPDQEGEMIGGLAIGIRATYLTWVVEGEVNNGGFNQYYFNTNGDFASEAVTAFEYFSATEHAALMREANSVRALEAEEMAKYKEQGSLEAFSESYEHSKLGPLDDRFYGLSENLSQLRINRIRQTPEEFSGQ